MNWETLACFGDSITIGARTYLGYPELTGDLLHKGIGNFWNVVNIATSGFTAIDLLRRIDEQGVNISNCHPDFFTLLIGTNDVKNSTPLLDFEIAYSLTILKILLTVKHNNGVLIKIPRLGKGVKYPYKYKMNDDIDKYNIIIAKLSNKYQLAILEIELEENDYYDGVHLNDKGNRKIGFQISSYILAQRGIINN